MPSPSQATVDVVFLEAVAGVAAIVPLHTKLCSEGRCPRVGEQISPSLAARGKSTNSAPLAGIPPSPTANLGCSAGRNYTRFVGLTSGAADCHDKQKNYFKNRKEIQFHISVNGSFGFIICQPRAQLWMQLK